jgi:hypothetical protein
VKSRISASSLDRAIACAASTALPAVWEESSPDAERGIAIHEFLDKSVTAGRDAALAGVPPSAPWRSLCEAIDIAWILQGAARASTELALAYHVDNDSGRVIGSHLNRRYGSTVGEIPSTADLVLEYENDSPLVIDWKAGHALVEVHGNRQMELLGLTVARARKVPSVRVAIGMVEESGVVTIDDVLTLGPLDLSRIANDVGIAWDAAGEAQRAVAAGESIDVRPGDHCRYCPCKASCPAHVGLIRELARAPGESLGPLLGEQNMVQLRASLRDRLANLDSETLGRAWSMLTVIEALVEEARTQLTSRIRDIGGVTLANGTRVESTQGRRESIDGRIALPILRTLGLEDAAEAKVTKAAIEREARRQTPNDLPAMRRKIENAIDRLREAGAVKESTYTSVKASAPKLPAGAAKQALA